MERQPGVALGTSFYQHQFFPVGGGGGGEEKWDPHGDMNRSDEWDVKAWNWDSVLFLAQPNPAAGAAPGPSVDPRVDDGKPIVVVDDASSLDEDPECLTLKLGGRTYSGMTSSTPAAAAGAAATTLDDGSNRNGKRQRSSSPGSGSQPPAPQYPMCQVDDCKADLTGAKDYHRRHKVCEMHSKSAKALVNRLMQRFCQQCSRFHSLQEFDEGKRSCRRRLAGHNRRRRKTQPEASAAQAYLLADDEVAGKSVALLRLLQLLAQPQAANVVEKVAERDIVMENLRRAISVSAALGDCMNTKAEANLFTGNPHKPDQKFNQLPPNTLDASHLLSTIPGMPLLEAFSVLLQNTLKPQAATTTASQAAAAAAAAAAATTTAARSTFTEYVPQQHQQQMSNRASVGGHSVIEVDGPPVQKFFPFQSGSSEATTADKTARDSNRPLLTLLGGRESPPSVAPPVANGQAGHSQQSSESLSGSEQSPESSYDWQDRTGRISFKLFDRNPGDFPQLLRTQILEWLSHVPLEMESYIRPGCVVLAIFLSMPRSAWNQLCNNLPGNLERLVDSSSSDFWRKGRILVQALYSSAYIIDGKVENNCSAMQFPRIHSVSPVAVVIGETTRIVVHGSSFIAPDTRVFSAYDGKYNALSWDQIEEEEEEDVEPGRLALSYEPSDSINRCFIEVETNGVSCFTPLLVAEPSICDEVRSLEDEILDAPSKAASLAKHWSLPEEIAEELRDVAQLAVEYETEKLLQELGWLLQKKHWRISGRPENFHHHHHLDSSSIKRLLLLSSERGWCSVVKLILDTMFSSSQEKHQSTATIPHILQSVNLLHRAVRRNNPALVETLLAYKLPGISISANLVFRPDEAGPAGLTPLHIAACMTGAEQIVSALTSDQVGLQAWNNARDFKGDTPFDYALSHGNLNYIQLVWSRIAAAKGKSSQVVLAIPPGGNWTTSTLGKPKLLLPSSCSNECRKLELEQIPNGHRFQRMAHSRRSPVYRPFMLSMVAIAAVCVCVCVLLKGPIRVMFLPDPFTWGAVQFGTK